jgi:hypothetical protein
LSLGILWDANQGTPTANSLLGWLIFSISCSVSLVMMLVVTGPIIKRFFVNWRASKQAVTVPRELRKKPDLLICDIPVGTVEFASTTDLSIDTKGRAWLRASSRLSTIRKLSDWTIEIRRLDSGYFVRVPKSYCAEFTKVHWTFERYIPVAGIEMESE